MTTAVATSAPVVPAREPHVFPAFVAAEWIKLRTVRSTLYTLAVAAFVAVGIGALASQRLAADVGGLRPGEKAGFGDHFDGISRSLVGGVAAQLAIGALGVLFVSSEFGTGMIRATIAAMPQRKWWITAKLAVFGGVVLVVGQVLTFVSFAVGQAILGTQGVGASLGDPGALRSVVATGLYISLVGILGMGFGLIVRHTAGALSSLLGALFVLPAITAAFSQPLQGNIMRLLPETVGEQSATPYQLSSHLAPWTGISLVAGYAAVLLLIGTYLLQRRDA